MSSDFESLSCDLEINENRWHGSFSDIDVLDEEAVGEKKRLPGFPPARTSTGGVTDRRRHRGPISGSSSTGAWKRELTGTAHRDCGVTTSEVKGVSCTAYGDGGEVCLSTENPANDSCCPHATIPVGDVKDTESQTNTRYEPAATAVTPRERKSAAWAVLTTQRAATCPPDSGTLTPATPATPAATTTSATSQATAGSAEGDNSASEEVRQRTETSHLDNVRHRRPLGHQTDVTMSSHAPLSPLTALPRRCTRDSDGFYNTGLLLDDDDDDDDEEEEEDDARKTESLHRSIAVSHRTATPRPSTASGVNPSPQHGSDAPVSGPRAPPTADFTDPNAAQCYEHPSLALSATTPSAATPRSLSIASRRKAADDELCRLAVGIPSMTTVQWLSLVITLLVPVNLLCLDVMALGWIRRRVDAGYGGTSALSSPGRYAISISSRMGICSAGEALNRASTAAPPLPCANNSTFTTGVSGAHTVTSVSTDTQGQYGSANASHPGKAGAPKSSPSSAHTVPALCSVILWLLAPNGLLCRLVIHRLRRSQGKSLVGGKKKKDGSMEDSTPPVPTAAMPSAPSSLYQALVSETDDSNDMRTEWQVFCDVYERVRQLAPQLEVIELFIRYACLLIMVHAALPCATAVSEWTDAWLLRAHDDDDDDDDDAVTTVAHSSGGRRAETEAATASSTPRRPMGFITAV